MQYFVFYLTLVLLFSLNTESFGKAKKIQLLLLQSYHPGFIWTDDIGRSFYSTITQNDPDIEVKTEFLDAKDHLYEEFSPKLDHFLRQKYQNRPFDIIVAADGEALEIATQILPALGAHGEKTPLFFTGINQTHYDDYIVRHPKHIPGIMEEVDYQNNIDLMFSLFPRVKTVAFIHDGSASSIRSYDSLISLFNSDPRTKGIRLESINGPSEKDLERQLKQLPAQNTVVFLVSYYNFQFEHVVKNANSFVTYLTSLTKAPVLSFWEPYLHRNLLGGHMLSGSKQGELVANQVLAYRAGKNYNDIPVQEEKTSSLYLNQKLIESYKLKKGQIPKNVTFFNIKKSPIDIFWTEIVSFLVVFSLLAGLTIYLFVIIVKKKTTEKELSQSLKKYKILVDKFPGALWMISDRGRIRYISEGFLERYKDLFSYEVKNYSSVSYPTWRKMIHPDDYQMVEDGFNNLFKKQIPLAIEYRLKTIDNSFNPAKVEWRWFEAQANEIIRDKNNEHIAIGVITDVTERKIIMDKIMAGHHLESLGTLASGIAHDFNNILQGISSSIENILEKQKNGQFQDINERLTDILNYEKRGSQLVRQILNFTGRHQTEKTPSNFSEKALDALKMIRSLIPQEIKIVTHFDENLWCELDESKIGQIVVNLCTNAADAFAEKIHGAEDSIIHITAQSTVLEPNDSKRLNLPAGRYIKLMVIDNATGINQELISRLIEPFFTTKSQRMRTGMGLSIVHGIVKFHEGTLKIESEKQQGTKITIYLPQIEPQSAPKDRTVTLSPIDKNGILQGKRILFVDDEIRILELTTEILKSSGPEVITATDGNEALSLFLNHPDYFDFIITDQSMPNMTGQEFVSEVRKYSKTIPIILVSGHINDSLQKMAINDPRLLIIPKPYRKRQLLDALVHFEMDSITNRII